MKKILIVFSIGAMAWSCGPSANTNTVSKKVEVSTPSNPTMFANTITEDELRKELMIYASDEMEGRETGQPGQKKAVEFLKNHYVSMGIPSPISKDDYFQEVPLQKLKSPKATLSVNGKEYRHIDDFISLATVSSGTMKASDFVYAGFGVDDEKYSDYKNLDVKGKIVVIKGGEPKNADGTYKVTGTTETSKWSNMRQAFADKQSAAKDRGAKGLFFYDDAIFAMVSPRYAAMEKQGGNGRISLIEDKEDFYFFLINSNLSNALVKDINNVDKPEQLSTDMTLNYENIAEDLSSENVIAYIKGSEKPDEYVVISAHLDHEGIKDGKIYNGADDDGSGTIAILEIAEAFKAAVDKGQGPKRSIVFLHVTGEEKGLLGSRHYTDNDPIFPLANTVANLNIDMIGRIDPKREGDRNYIYLIGSDKLSTDLHNLSEAVNKKYMNIELDYTFNDDNDPNRFYYRSDHYNFAKNNVPIIFYFNGTHDDYHQPSDTPDKINYDLLENRTRLVFYTAWEVANRDARIVVDKATEAGN